VSPRCCTPNFGPRRSTRREPNSEHNGGVTTDNRVVKCFRLQRGAARGRFQSPVRNFGALGPNEPRRRCRLPSQGLHGSTQAVAENLATLRSGFVHGGGHSSAHSQITRSVVACEGDRGAMVPRIVYMDPRRSVRGTPQRRPRFPRGAEYPERSLLRGRRSTALLPQGLTG
jgi:hypothetical protein